jgi:hypothetical protein
MIPGTLEENKLLVQERGLQFPILTIEDTRTGVTLDYKVPGTPFFYVLDETGVIQNVGFANTKEQLDDLARAGGE